MNAYEVKAGSDVIAGNTCDPCLSALDQALYKSTLHYCFGALYIDTCRSLVIPRGFHGDD